MGPLLFFTSICLSGYSNQNLWRAANLLSWTKIHSWRPWQRCDLSLVVQRVCGASGSYSGQWQQRSHCKSVEGWYRRMSVHTSRASRSCVERFLRPEVPVFVLDWRVRQCRCLGGATLYNQGELPLPKQKASHALVSLTHNFVASGASMERFLPWLDRLPLSWTWILFNVLIHIFLFFFHNFCAFLSPDPFLTQKL